MDYMNDPVVLESIKKHVCPDCGKKAEFMVKATAGISANIYCEHCNSKYLIVYGFGDLHIAYRIKTEPLVETSV
jgi:DNA-directed RNA polymerase subunit RPC12/RpoP